MNVRIGLDFETYSATDLPKHGLDRYLSDPHFRVLRASIALSKVRGVNNTCSYDFVQDPYAGTRFGHQLQHVTEIVAHNAGFEKAVLQHMGFDVRKFRFLDSAVVARAAGAASKLEAAAPQLLGVNKVETGTALIKLFSIPSKEQIENGDLEFNEDLVRDNPDKWIEFGKYCDIDADLSLRIVNDWGMVVDELEWDNNMITMHMNEEGWHVDQQLVDAMQQRYEANKVQALEQFRELHDPKGELNLNSFPQLTRWCKERGINAKSFDEKHVAQMLLTLAKKRGSLMSGRLPDNYAEVRDLLLTKQTLGGSSLKKLETIKNMVGRDGRLRHQYLHAGAGQTFRTSGRGVQMQNLKRLGETPADMEEVYDEDIVWDNGELARNLRQVFAAEHPQGELIVGDFSSVESRGLAFLAGEDWKLEAYKKGMDLYKVLAGKIFHVEYDEVTKPGRQTGKVGELSCGYQAGGGAVAAFAANMGVEMTEAEAMKLVSDWRAANPNIVSLWEDLDDALREAVLGQRGVFRIGDYEFAVEPWITPDSLLLINPKAQSVALTLSRWPTGERLVFRVFHGCNERGRSINYYKPSALKGGDLWVNHYRDPKTGQVKFYSVYGGKLTGILTQSFCREIFFYVLRGLMSWIDNTPNIRLIGQFHDEIVLEWWPSAHRDAIDIEVATRRLNLLMSLEPTWAIDFPLAAEVKHDHRYTK